MFLFERRDQSSVMKQIAGIYTNTKTKILLLTHSFKIPAHE